MPALTCTHGSNLSSQRGEIPSHSGGVLVLVARFWAAAALSGMMLALVGSRAGWRYATGKEESGKEAPGASPKRNLYLRERAPSRQSHRPPEASARAIPR